MSAKYLTLSWDELKTVRIACKGCGTIFESGVEKLDTRLNGGESCPVCRNPFLLSLGDGKHENMLKRLVQNFVGLDKLKDKFAIEFVIPITE